MSMISNGLGCIRHRSVEVSVSLPNASWGETLSFLRVNEWSSSSISLVKDVVLKNMLSQDETLKDDGFSKLKNFLNGAKSKYKEIGIQIVQMFLMKKTDNLEGLVLSDAINRSKQLGEEALFEILNPESSYCRDVVDNYASHFFSRVVKDSPCVVIEKLLNSADLVMLGEKLLNKFYRMRIESAKELVLKHLSSGTEQEKKVAIKIISEGYMIGLSFSRDIVRNLGDSNRDLLNEIRDRQLAYINANPNNMRMVFQMKSPL